MNSVASQESPAALGQELASAGYLRVRRRPRWRDGDYLSLRDLNQLIEAQSADFAGDVFDYGCGGAPYADLFADCRRYVKADVVPGPGLDRLLGPDGLTSEPDASYDWVFSTQVLEHVPEPARYLAECRRLLRPGGRVLLTTHGLFPEHGCPFDFHRWTAEGLAREVKAAGLVVEEAGKLTTGIRGAIQLWHHGVWDLRHDEGGWWVRLALGVLRKAYGLVAVPVLNAVGDRFPGQGKAPVSAPAAIYVGVYVRARRPAS